MKKVLPIAAVVIPLLLTSDSIFAHHGTGIGEIGEHTV